MDKFENYASHIAQDCYLNKDELFLKIFSHKYPLKDTDQFLNSLTSCYFNADSVQQEVKYRSFKSQHIEYLTQASQKRIGGPQKNNFLSPGLGGGGLMTFFVSHLSAFSKEKNYILVISKKETI